VLHAPLELVDYVCGQLHQIMSKPRVELGGEAIGVEIAIGTDLRKSNMDTWHPPTSGLTPAPEVDRVGGNGHVTTGK
jgi:hypothetical protein